MAKFSVLGVMLGSFFCSWWYLAASRKPPVRQVAILYNFTSCPGVKSEGDVLSNITYVGNDEYSLDLDLVYDGGLMDNIKCHISFSLCPTRELEGCQDLISFPVDDFCELITHEDSFMHEVLLGMDPPADSCPLVGTHSMRNFITSKVSKNTFKFLGLSTFPEQNVYKFEMKIVHKNKLIYCIFVIGSMRTVRNVKVVKH